MRRRLSVIAVQLVVFLVLAEAAALVFFYFDTGRLFYTYRKPYPVIAETAQGALTGDALHPYFGPIHRTGVRPETNNVGFGSPYPFPYARTSDRQVLIGIFGGSVARQFCDRGAPAMIAALGQQERFRGREIVPLCFAHEGYKQPQQLLVLSYFLSLGQAFDLVVNIDGFNEVALGTYNDERGRDISMPSPLHLDPLISLVDRATLTPDAVDSLAAINRYKQTLNDVVARIQATRFASVGVGLDVYYTVTRRRYDAERAHFVALPPPSAETSLIQVTPAVKSRTRDTLYEDIAADWASASRLMRDMLAARAVPYLHVLQPNQYYGSRVFGPDEARIALNDSTPFKPPIERGYPVLVQAGRTLAQEESFADATTLFDRETGAVYEDDCCHYTNLGNELLGRFVAARLAETEPSPRTR